MLNREAKLFDGFGERKWSNDDDYPTNTWSVRRWRDANTQTNSVLPFSESIHRNFAFLADKKRDKEAEMHEYEEVVALPLGAVVENSMKKWRV